MVDGASVPGITAIYTEAFLLAGYDQTTCGAWMIGALVGAGVVAGEGTPRHLLNRGYVMGVALLRRGEP